MGFWRRLSRTFSSRLRGDLIILRGKVTPPLHGRARRNTLSRKCCALLQQGGARPPACSTAPTARSIGRIVIPLTTVVVAVWCVVTLFAVAAVHGARLSTLCLSIESAAISAPLSPSKCPLLLSAGWPR